jgi:hypothetical protein
MKRMGNTNSARATAGFVTILEAKKRGVPAVLAEMGARRDHPGVTQHSLWALGDLMAVSDEGSVADQAAQSEEVLFACLDAMRAHRNHPVIQRNGIQLLDVMWTSSSVQLGDMVAKEGVVAAVVSAIQSHPDSTLRDIGWKLLVELGEYQSMLENQPPTDEGDGTERVIRINNVVRAMAVHVQRLGVQEYGVSQLYGLVSGDDGAALDDEERTIAAEALVAAGGISAVLRAMQTHAGQTEVQTVGLALFRLCIESGDRVNDFVGRAMAAHPGAARPTATQIGSTMRGAVLESDSVLTRRAQVESGRCSMRCVV